MIVHDSGRDLASSPHRISKLGIEIRTVRIPKVVLEIRTVRISKLIQADASSVFDATDGLIDYLPCDCSHLRVELESSAMANCPKCQSEMDDRTCPHCGHAVASMETTRAAVDQGDRFKFQFGLRFLFFLIGSCLRHLGACA
jgi:hypothetical protein